MEISSTKPTAASQRRVGRTRRFARSPGKEKRKKIAISLLLRLEDGKKKCLSLF